MYKLYIVNKVQVSLVWRDYVISLAAVLELDSQPAGLIGCEWISVYSNWAAEVHIFYEVKDLLLYVRSLKYRL